MKKILIVLTCLGLTNVAMAEVEKYNGKTDCYLFKNSKLIKKASCTYKGSSEYTGNGSGADIDFKMQGVPKPFKMSFGSYFQDSGYELNGKKVTRINRLKSNLNTIVADDKIPDDMGYGSKTIIACLKNNKNEEFCYAEGGLGLH